MSDQRRDPSASYMECAGKLRQLHDLVRSGDGDSDRADLLRDAMDDDWLRMLSEERAWTGDLSADLYVLGKSQPLFGDRPADGTVRQQMLNAGRQDDWVGLRVLLNSDADSVGLFDRILFRAIYWAALKDYGSSLEFLNTLVGRVEKERLEFEVMQSGLDRLARSGNVPEQIAVVRDLGQRALERIARVADEIKHLIGDIESMNSSTRVAEDGSAVWEALKEKFLRADEYGMTLLKVPA